MKSVAGIFYRVASMVGLDINVELIDAAEHGSNRRVKAALDSGVKIDDETLDEALTGADDNHHSDSRKLIEEWVEKNGRKLPTQRPALNLLELLEPTKTEIQLRKELRRLKAEDEEKIEPPFKSTPKDKYLAEHREYINCLAVYTEEIENNRAHIVAQQASPGPKPKP